MTIRGPVALAIGCRASLEALPFGPHAELQEAYALLWSLWRVGEPSALLIAIRRTALHPNSPVDPLVQGFLLAIDSWQGNGAGECGLEVPVLASLPPTARALLAAGASNRDGCYAAGRVSHVPLLTVDPDSTSPFCHRLARLVDATAKAAGTGPEGMLRCIESFSHVSSWLKVAGDAKAEVLEGTICGRPPRFGECLLELGAFVGYSSIRFANQAKRLRCDLASPSSVSLEIDPLHCVVSRHHLDLSMLAREGEVWPGQLQDTVARVAEAFGEGGLAFVFMDQRGTTFHEDLSRLESFCVMAQVSNAAADNTLKPGAPVYLWHVAVGATSSFCTELWAMAEFGLHEIEDWQSVSVMNGDFASGVAGPSVQRVTRRIMS